MIPAQSFTRHDVSFTSGKDSCAAGLYLPTGVTSPPVVVLGHGLGATREMRLDAFVERFARAGIAALAFTYRHFGDSSGQPRQLLSIKRQLADWGRFGDARQSQRQPNPDHYRPGRLRHVTDSRAGSQDHRRPGVDWPSQSDSTAIRVNEQGRSAGARRQRRQRPDGLDREVGRAGPGLAHRGARRQRKEGITCRLYFIWTSTTLGRHRPGAPPFCDYRWHPAGLAGSGRPAALRRDARPRECGTPLRFSASSRTADGRHVSMSTRSGPDGKWRPLLTRLCPWSRSRRWERRRCWACSGTSTRGRRAGKPL